MTIGTLTKLAKHVESLISIAVGLGTASGASLVGYAHTTAGAVVRNLGDRLKTKVNVLDFGVVLGAVGYPQAEANLLAINKASAYAKSVGAEIVEFPAGDIWIRRLTGNDGSDPANSYCILRSGVHFKGAGKLRTRIVRAGPHSPFVCDARDGPLVGAAVRDMTIWGNPSVAGYTAYSANLLYINEGKDCLIDNVLFMDVPGLHAIDINGTEGLTITRCDFFGYDISLRGADPTYYPESIQMGLSESLLLATKNVRIRQCRVGPSVNYPAPLVFLGNHSGGGGGAANAVEDVIVEDVVANGLVNYMFRSKAWKNLTLLRCRQESGIARFLYLDYKPAYPEAGTGNAGCIDTTVKDCYHNGDGEFIYTNVMSTTADPIARHRDLKVIGGEVVGRAATNAITIHHTIGFTFERLKVRASRRAAAMYWCSEGSIIDPDFDGMEVNGIEVTDSSGYGTGLGLNKNLIVSGGRITNCKNYVIYLGAMNGYTIENVDISGGAALAGAQNAIHLFGLCNNGVVRNVVGVDRGNAFAPMVGVNITSGANNIVENVRIHCTGDQVNNAGTGNSYEIRPLVYRSAMPTSGTWRKGTIVKITVPVVGSPRGWVRLTDGSNNVLGTDWVSEGNL